MMDISQINLDDAVYSRLRLSKNQKAHVSVFPNVAQNIAALLKGEKNTGHVADIDDPVDAIEGAAENMKRLGKESRDILATGLDALKDLDAKTALERVKAATQFIDAGKWLAPASPYGSNGFPRQNAQHRAREIAMGIMFDIANGLAKANPEFAQSAQEAQLIGTEFKTESQGIEFNFPPRGLGNSHITDRSIPTQSLEKK